MTSTRSRRELARAFTGLVVAGLAVDPDVDRWTVRCPRCPEHAPALGVGDRAVATLTCYDNHTWELLDVFCPAHGPGSVDAVGVAAEDQAVVGATLEAASYHSPDGRFYPDALTLGAVSVRDYSPAADGY